MVPDTVSDPDTVSVTPFPHRFRPLLTLVLSFKQGSKEVRRFHLYFPFLYALMVLLDAGSTKRLLFISPWLLLGVACALADRTRTWSRWLLLASLSLIAASGWFGTLTRRYYASTHFLEPWPQVAQ